MAVWNKKFEYKGRVKKKCKICSLNQDLIREDTNVPIDPASKESINDDANNSGAQVTDRIDLFEVDGRNKKSS